MRPLQERQGPYRRFDRRCSGDTRSARGCTGRLPLNNLAQEMSPLDAGFRKRLAIIFDAWHEAVALALREGQTQGTVRRDVEPDDAAGLLIAMVEGYGCWQRMLRIRK